MGGPPAGAVCRHDLLDADCLHVGHGRGDDRLEESPCQVKPPDKGEDPLLTGEALGVRRTLTAPAWEQPDTTTRPRSRTFTIAFWSSQIHGSGSHPPSWVRV